MSPRWLVDPAAVALGSVPAEQRELARNLIAADPDFRAEVERRRALMRTLGELPGEAWEPEEAPALDVDRVLTRPPAEPAPVPLAPARRRPRRLVLRPAFAAAAAALLLLAGGLTGALVAGGGTTATPDRRAAAPADTDPWVLASLRPLAGTSSQAAGRVALTLHPGGRARLRLRGLPATRRGAFYEAWLMTDGRHLVALGTFTVGADGRAQVEFPVGADPRAYRYVDVSLQHQADGPRHSGDSVLRSAQLG